METTKLPKRIVDVTAYYYFAHPTYSTDHSCDTNSHSYTELNAVLSGSAELIVDGTSYILEKNQLFFIPPNISHANKILSHNTKFVTCAFETDIKLPMHIYNLNHTATTILQLMINEFMEQKLDSSRFQFADYCTQALVNLTELLIIECIKVNEQKPSSNSAPSTLFNKACKFMWNNMSTSFTINDIAAHCNVSPSNLKNIFKKHANMGVIMYYNELRLERARSMLFEGETITTIVETLGYYSASHFSKAFKSKYGVSPSKFLK